MNIALTCMPNYLKSANDDVVYKLHNMAHSTPISGEDGWNLWANLRLDFVIS